LIKKTKQNSEKLEKSLPLPRPEWSLSTGLVPYPEALVAMEQRVAAIAAGTAAEQVWLLEHPPLYTAGTSADPAELLGIQPFPIYETGRGGRHTYHGPGQRVAYVMLDLRQRGGDIRAHIQRLEEWVILALADFGVQGERRCDRIGVWVNNHGREEKIAAVGVRVRRWVTFHGIAINIAPDLGHFGGIVPCGIRDYGVTSLQVLGKNPDMAAFDTALARHWDRAFANDQAPSRCA
jgi:lipoyl(octanoyl) transferase